MNDATVESCSGTICPGGTAVAHTFTSCEVAQRARHCKLLLCLVFKKRFKPVYINLEIQLLAKDFCGLFRGIRITRMQFFYIYVLSASIFLTFFSFAWNGMSFSTWFTCTSVNVDKGTGLFFLQQVGYQGDCSPPPYPVLTTVQ